MDGGITCTETRVPRPIGRYAEGKSPYHKAWSGVRRAGTAEGQGSARIQQARPNHNEATYTICTWQVPGRYLRVQYM